MRGRARALSRAPAEEARGRASPRGPWIALAAYVAVLYTILPFGPRIGLSLARTGPGAWLLGPGLPLVAMLGAGLLLGILVRRRAPAWAYALLLAAAAGYLLAFYGLRGQRLERTHLPEYGIAAWLAWRALRPLVPGAVPGYAAAAALAAAIGYGDELLQWMIPGRYYDLRDVGMNALGGLLGVMVLAAVRAGDRAAGRRG